ncbi:MAG: hypothetical protein ABIC19_03370 [Patescibacteria group bacterium]
MTNKLNRFKNMLQSRPPAGKIIIAVAAVIFYEKKNSFMPQP